MVHLRTLDAVGDEAENGSGPEQRRESHEEDLDKLEPGWGGLWWGKGIWSIQTQSLLHGLDRHTLHDSSHTDLYSYSTMDRRNKIIPVTKRTMHHTTLVFIYGL